MGAREKKSAMSFSKPFFVIAALSLMGCEAEIIKARVLDHKWSGQCLMTHPFPERVSGGLPTLGMYEQWRSLWGPYYGVRPDTPSPPPKHFVDVHAQASTDFEGVRVLSIRDVDERELFVSRLEKDGLKVWALTGGSNITNEGIQGQIAVSEGFEAPFVVSLDRDLLAAFLEEKKANSRPVYALSLLKKDGGLLRKFEASSVPEGSEKSESIFFHYYRAGHYFKTTRPTKRGEETTYAFTQAPDASENTIEPVLSFNVVKGVRKYAWGSEKAPVIPSTYWGFTLKRNSDVLPGRRYDGPNFLCQLREN
jgi:hypothetical protein